MRLSEYMEDGEVKKVWVPILKRLGAQDVVIAVDDEKVTATALFENGRAEVLAVVPRGELDKEAEEILQRRAEKTRPTRRVTARRRRAQ